MIAPTLMLAGCVLATFVQAQALHSQSAERVRLAAAEPNDNRVRAGRLKDGVLTVRLEARPTRWHPEERGGAAVSLFAFAEEGKHASIPGPMLRVPIGTTVHAAVRNALPVPVRLRGLQERAGAALDSIVLSPGETRELRFRANVAGTFYYWGRTDAFPANAGPGARRDAMLLGAFIVDSAGAPPRADERVFVFSVWSDTAATLGVKSEHADLVMSRETVPRERWLVSTINGKSWPHTERLSYTVGDTVRWRLINGSRYPHPMHLHGFYFRVDASGDVVSDTVYEAAARRQAVTEWMERGGTKRITWVPERSGNWLFHCHIVQHISDATRLGHVSHDAMAHAPTRPARAGNHAERMMAGMVTGIHVAPARGTPRAPEVVPRRRLRLFVTERAKVYGDWPGFSYVLQEGPTPPARDSIRALASTIALRQHEPAEITVFNVTSQTTMVHWHGLELESFFDGVGGWSGWGTRLAPSIAPGDSFVVRLTPPRAGTFMYHTHADEGIQLPSGMYGALVVHPAAAPDTTERLLVLGMGGPLADSRPLINGHPSSPPPPPMALRSGVAHRLRIVNVSPLESHAVRLVSGDSLQRWRVVAKDGADLPEAMAVSRAATQVIHPGDTYDVELLRQRPESLTLRVVSAETAVVRAAFAARARPGELPPRIVTDVPVHVR